MSWVTWEPKSTIRTFSCMDGDVSRTYPESGAQRPFGAAFCGLCAVGSSLPDCRSELCVVDYVFIYRCIGWSSDVRLRPVFLGAPPAACLFSVFQYCGGFLSRVARSG